MRSIKRLSSRQIANLKTPGRDTDGAGLELQISPTGTKSWLFRYCLHGREHRIGLGPLHTVGLAEAREKARQARLLILDGRDPIVEKRRSRSLSESVVTFRECADEFCKAKLSSFRSAKHKSQWRSSLDVACKVMGNTPIDDIDTALVLRVLKPLWDRAPETASRLRGRIERVLGFAIASGHRKNDSNPARWQGHLKDLFPPRPTTKHFSAVDYRELPELMRRVRGNISTAACAFEFCILTAARTNEVLGARWDEVNLDEATWTIPASRTKRHKEHVVPLSDRAIEILSGVSLERPHSPTDLIFGGGHTAMLRVLQSHVPNATVHGFRSTFKDWA